MAKQRATITGLRIRSPSDARVIFYSVFLNILPMVTRRLDTKERRLISTGSVYVWEERGTEAELTGEGIERWRDGICWGPGRVREGFLCYHEKPTSQQLSQNMPCHDPSLSCLIKQTYTVFVDAPRGRRKWHLVAYFTKETVSRLRSIDDVSQLASLSVPHGEFKNATSRSTRARMLHVMRNTSLTHPSYVSILRPKFSYPFHPASQHRREDHTAPIRELCNSGFARPR